MFDLPRDGDRHGRTGRIKIGDVKDRAGRPSSDRAVDGLNTTRVTEVSPAPVTTSPVELGERQQDIVYGGFFAPQFDTVGL